MWRTLGKWVGAVLLVAIIFGSGAWLGYARGRAHPEKVVIEHVANSATPGEVQADMSNFWQAWKVIDDNYLKNPEVTPANKVSGAIKGLVGSLQDPYSEFFPAREARKFQEDVQGNFGGIGAELGIQRGQLVVVAPLKNTPASRAGLKAGDKIFKVNASSTQDVFLEEAVAWIRGPVGTPVTLTVFRDGWEKTKDIKFTREVVQVPTLDFSMKGNIAYVELYGFNANAEDLFAKAVRDVSSKGARGMVLDLRDDPGGYLDVAVNLAGWFLPKGTLVVSEVSRTEPKQELKADGNALLVNFPIVVLINQGSASASEILAGALRDDRRIKLVGQTSFGKGTVQEIFPVLGDATLKLTIAHWVLPKGQILENGGLKPDVEVTLTDEDVLNKKDPQLDKAMEILKAQITNNS